MNRYRNAPGVRGPTKATASTLCQKCLKRDMFLVSDTIVICADVCIRHYSYECKATAQERPYLARPSRTQQLHNPNLRPQLTTDLPDTNVPTKGTAGALLAQREEERGRQRDFDALDPLDERPLASKRTRSLSSASASSVSTISTNRSRSHSPQRERHQEQMGRARAKSQSSHHSWSRKRRHSDASSGYSVSSYSSAGRSRTRSPGRNMRRRRRESSPKERGRPRDISHEGDRRERSRSRGIEKSRIVRGRQTITPEETAPRQNHARRSSPRVQPSNFYNDRRQDERHRPPPPRHERSLSPFSKRLALTQAMNMGS
ncbi:hypothetical protein BJX99DRAFT_47189 [Aspergillus californicus]